MGEEGAKCYIFKVGEILFIPVTKHTLSWQTHGTKNGIKEQWKQKFDYKETEFFIQCLV